jgi:hypothetical protein
MQRPSPLTWLPLWERALEVEIGIGFVVSGVDRDYFRNTLYETRKQSGDPRLSELVMFLPAAPLDNQIWICKKAVEMEG